MASSVASRLAELRRRGTRELAPLWIEGLPHEEALEVLSGFATPLSRLQQARFLLCGGRPDDARQLLDASEQLPKGLQSVRDALLAELEGRTASPGPKRDAFPGEIATKTLAELYISQGDVEAAIATYQAVLTRDPDDGEAGRRLLELLGQGLPTEEAVLGTWLENVKGWRRALGV